MLIQTAIIAAAFVQLVMIAHINHKVTNAINKWQQTPYRDNQRTGINS